MWSGGGRKQWSYGKASVVSLQKVGSLIRDFCLSQSRIQVIITISKMLKPEKWQASFDSEGRVSGFQKALKLIILGGIDPSIRAEVWEFLLGCYALSSTSEYRNQLRVARRLDGLIASMLVSHQSVGESANSLLKVNHNAYKCDFNFLAGSDTIICSSNARRCIQVWENRGEACIDSNDNANIENCHSDWSNNGTDTSHVHRRRTSSGSANLVSGRESPESVVYNTSSFVSASSSYG